MGPSPTYMETDQWLGALGFLLIVYMDGEVSVNTQYFLEYLIFPQKSVQKPFEKYAKKVGFSQKRLFFFATSLAY